MPRNFKMVSKIVFGRGSINQIEEIFAPLRINSKSYIVFLVDKALKTKDYLKKINLISNDYLFFVNTDNEPTTYYVDELTNSIKNKYTDLPVGIIGIGGGTTMDLAKAVSLMLTNEGASADYQGWDLIKKPAIYHAGIPTLSGTGSEVSRTTVLSGPTKKLGINSDFTVFDQVILDPDLIADVPLEQRFHTAMDCYVHAVESLTGNFINEFAKGYGEKSMALIRDVFLNTNISSYEADEKLMIASMFGGMSIAYSQVGVCHALSYGITYLLKLRHGFGNCIVFNSLDDYYPEYVKEFREIMKINKITLPTGLTHSLTDEEFEKMIDISLVLEPLWENALGKEWKKIMTRQKIKELFKKM